jgi:hypothetical protein
MHEKYQAGNLNTHTRRAVNDGNDSDGSSSHSEYRNRKLFQEKATLTGCEVE